MTATLSLFDVPAAVDRPARPARPQCPAEVGALSPGASPDTPARPQVEAFTAERLRTRPHVPGPVAQLTRAGKCPGRALRAVTTLAVLVVALVAAVVSYEHLRALSIEAGEGWRAWLIPLSVDGLIVAGSMTAVSNRRAGRSTGALPWLALVLGALASLGANVAAAEPTVVGRVVAAWPPVALLIGHELLLRQLRR